MKIAHWLRNFWMGQKGFSTVEYLIGAAVVAGIAITAIVLSIGLAQSNLEEKAPDQYEADYYQTM